MIIPKSHVYDKENLYNKSSYYLHCFVYVDERVKVDAIHSELQHSFDVCFAWICVSSVSTYAHVALCDLPRVVRPQRHSGILPTELLLCALCLNASEPMVTYVIWTCEVSLLEVINSAPRTINTAANTCLQRGVQ